MASVSSFNRGLQALGSGSVSKGGRWVVMPPASPPPVQARRAQAIERRRKVFTTLICICGASLVLGLLPGLRWMLLLHVAADLLLVSLAVVLINTRSTRTHRPAGSRQTAWGSHVAVGGRPAAPQTASNARRTVLRESGRFETLETPLVRSGREGSAGALYSARGQAGGVGWERKPAGRRPVFDAVEEEDESLNYVSANHAASNSRLSSSVEIDEEEADLDDFEHEKFEPEQPELVRARVGSPGRAASKRKVLPEWDEDLEEPLSMRTASQKRPLRRSPISVEDYDETLLQAEGL